jgi:hypothetical protein
MIGPERDPVCSLHLRHGERRWAVYYYVAVCGRRRHLLQFPDHCHHRKLASGCYQPFVSVASHEIPKCETLTVTDYFKSYLDDLGMETGR